MSFLTSPFSYFTERTAIPFMYGFLAVFAMGGGTLLVALLGLTWVSFADVDTAAASIDAVSLESLSLAFFGPFALWGVLTTVVYMFLLWYGRYTTEYLTIMAFIGVGFVPIAGAVCIELAAATWLTLTTTVTSDVTAVHFIFTVHGTERLAVALTTVYAVSVAWTVYIWIGAITKVGGVSLGKALLCAITLGVGVAVHIIALTGVL